MQDPQNIGAVLGQERSVVAELGRQGVDLGRRERFRGDGSLQDRIIAVNTRLDLRAPEEIRSQFRKAGWALQEWAAKANRAAPETVEGYKIIHSGMGALQNEADRLYPAVEEEIEELKVMMRQHLASLDDRGLPPA